MEKDLIIKKLSDIAKSEIKISYSKSEKPLGIYESKIGGKPSVPADFKWCEYTGSEPCSDDEPVSRPLSFMAQINLRDIAEYDTENLLPKSGILSFFYEQVSMTWGFDPKDKGSAKVCYFPENVELVPMDYPKNLDEEFIIPELAMNFQKKISLPGIETFEEIFGECDCDLYDQCCEELGYKYDEWGNVTKLLGFPDVIQNPMEEECEKVSRGYYCGNPEAYKRIPNDEKADIKAKSADWTLLFQMGTIETDDREIMFGDCGHLYFWIRKQDLKNLDFDKAWLICQCG